MRGCRWLLIIFLVDLSLIASPHYVQAQESEETVAPADNAASSQPAAAASESRCISATTFAQCSCPESSSPTSIVMKGKQVCLPIDLYVQCKCPDAAKPPQIQDAPPSTPPAPITIENKFSDPEPRRIIYGSTALPRKSDTWSLTIYNIVWWSLDYTVNENIELGLQFNPPLGIIGFLPHLKLSAKIAEKLHAGVLLRGGILFPFIANSDNWQGYLYGGGPMLTYGDEDFLVNFSAAYYGVLGGNTNDFDSAWIALPSFGLSTRVHKRVKFNLEVYLPLGDYSENGKVWAVLYGIRVFGERLYGDISFVVPLAPDIWEALQYFPMGFPLLGFGWQW